MCRWKFARRVRFLVLGSGCWVQLSRFEVLCSGRRQPQFSPSQTFDRNAARAARPERQRVLLPPAIVRPDRGPEKSDATPTRRRISRDAAGIIGDNRTAARRIASAASKRTWLNRSVCDGSFASAQGAAPAICRFAASIRRNTCGRRVRNFELVHGAPVCRRNLIGALS